MMRQVWGTAAYDTWHWDEFLDWAQKGLVASGGKVSQWAIEYSYGLYNTFIAALGTLGGQMWAKEWIVSDTGGQKCVCDSDVAIEAAIMIVDPIIKTPGVVINPAYSAATFPDGAFPAGHTVLAESALAPANWPPKNTFEQSYMALPFVNHRTFLSAPNMFCVNKASANVDAAVEYAVKACTNPTALKYVNDTQCISGFKPAEFVAKESGWQRALNLTALSRSASRQAFLPRLLM